MWTRNPALDVNAYPTDVGLAEESLQMDQDEFRAFYDKTARSVWVFLLRRCGNDALADDLLQETYYRLLKTRRDFEGESHRRHYLFRIASNLANDALKRRQQRGPEDLADPEQLASNEADAAATSLNRTDLARAMEKLKPRQREALWLAYAEGSSHEEIAEVLGLRKGSVKILLFRARRKLAELLRGNGGTDSR